MTKLADWTIIAFFLAARAGLIHGGGWESMKVTKVMSVQVTQMVPKAA